MVRVPIGDAIDWSVPPDGFDRLAADLRSMRRAAGDPSFAEIARRIAAARAARGVPEYERRVARSTLYDCFRDGRRRMDPDAVMEIALALGLPERLRSPWAARLRAARAAADGASVAAAREEMPPPVPSFVGREAELTRIEQAVAGAPSGRGAAVWVTGMAGSGKTQLALRVAERLADRGVKGIFVDLRGHREGTAPVAPAAAQRAVLRLLGVDEAFAGDERSRARQLGELLREADRLLVLDDASGLDQVRRILGDEPAGSVVVTSRAFPAEGDAEWTQVALAGLDAEETRELLVTLARPAPEAAATVTLAEAERLTEACGGLPLAIALVGSRLATREGWSLADHVDLLHRRISEGRVDDALRAELDLSYAELPAAAARLLRACADLPVAEVGPASMALLLETTTELAEAAAATLTERNLAVRGLAGGIALHSLVRAYALDRAEETDPPGARRDAFARVARHQAERVWAAYDVLARDLGDLPRPTAFEYPRLSWTAEEASRWLSTHVAGVLALAHQAPERGCPELLFRISEGLSWWMNYSGRLVAALRLHEAAADHASDGADADALAMASLDAGQLYIHRDRPEQALMHFSRVRRLIGDADRLTDPGLLGVLRNMESLVLIRRGRLDEAIRSLTWAVELHDERNESSRVLSALTNLGVALHAAGRFQEEAGVLDRGLRRATSAGDDLHRTYFLVNRAELFVETGALQSAADEAAAALALAEKIGVPFLAVSARGVIAEVLRRRGDLAGADDELAQALEAARAMALELTVAELLVIAAQIAVDRRDEAAAAEALSEAESLFAEDGDHILRGRVWSLRGDLCDDPAQRRSWHERAVAEFVRAGAVHRAAALRAAHDPPLG